MAFSYPSGHAPTWASTIAGDCAMAATRRPVASIVAALPCFARHAGRTAYTSALLESKSKRRTPTLSVEGPWYTAPVLLRPRHFTIKGLRPLEPVPPLEHPPHRATRDVFQNFSAFGLDNYQADDAASHTTCCSAANSVCAGCAGDGDETHEDDDGDDGLA